MGASCWYKLTGTLTGVASAKNYGVRVKAGKTVYVDEMHLQVGVGTAQTMYVMNSNTGVTGLNVQGLINGTLNGIATYSKAGTLSDSDFGGGVDNGMMAIDSTNGRIYFRYGGSWHYASQTAGFQIPKEEVEGLSKGDYLAPYVDTFMSDGAVHGLYKKLDINDILESTSSVTFKNSVSFHGPALFSKLAEFFGTTIFHTPPTFPNNMGGIAVIPPSSTTVDVSFPTPFETPPVVRMSLVLDSSTSSAFLSDKLRAAIFGVTEHGFSIVLNTPVPANTTYHWMALSVQGDTP